MPGCCPASPSQFAFRSDASPGASLLPGRCHSSQQQLSRRGSANCHSEMHRTESVETGQGLAVMDSGFKTTLLLECFTRYLEWAEGDRLCALEPDNAAHMLWSHGTTEPRPRMLWGDRNA